MRGEQPEADFMNIGSITLSSPTVLAPLAGITNLPFRLIAKENGCGLVCSEMISSNGLVYRSGKTHTMLESVAEEKPLSVQIFGSDPFMMAEAAVMVEASGADILDINFGCSVKKVLKTGSGAALMRDVFKAEAILRAVRSAIRIPLTIKIRTGWDKSGKQALDIARMAEGAGVDAIAVHPRTAQQMFQGNADWSVIAAVKQSVSIPIIGNGDIDSPETAADMFAQTGCDAVMVGRHAMGNPWIFSQIDARLRSIQHPLVNIARRREIMIRYVKVSVRHLGEKLACPMMRSRLGWFVRGLPESSRFRESVKYVSSEKDAVQRIESYMDRLILQDAAVTTMA
jgi:nifR3 family TIM-barrel protein